MHREILALFPTFDALMAERSVSRAAERLRVSQSAISQSLARLRVLLSDQLFVSTGREMIPTPRALQILPHVRTALSAVEAVASANPIDLSDLSTTFVIDLGAGSDMIVLPELRKELAARAPKLKLQITNLRSVDPVKALKLGEIHLAIEFLPTDGDGVRCVRMTESDSVVIARRDHPDLKHGLSEAGYQRLKHVSLNWNRPAAPSAVALELARAGRPVESSISVPTLAGLATVVATSDLIATVARFVAKPLSERFDLDIHPLPFVLQPIQLFQLWHARYDGDPAHQWLREIVEKVMVRLFGTCSKE